MQAAKRCAFCPPQAGGPPWRSAFFDKNNPGHFWRWYATFLGRYFDWRSIIFVHSVVGLSLLAFDVPMTQIVLLYGLPVVGLSLQRFSFGRFPPHSHREGQPFADRHNARSNYFGTLASLATCFHFGYHLKHHHRPAVSSWSPLAAKRAGVGKVEVQRSTTGVPA
jgi:beta-carotene ketolase (CrtW type)